MKILKFNLFLFFGFLLVTICHLVYYPNNINFFLFLIFCYQAVVLNIIFLIAAGLRKYVVPNKEVFKWKYVYVSGLALLLIWNIVEMSLYY